MVKVEITMKIVFSEKFFESDYANDCAAVSGRLEAIISSLKQENSYEFVSPEPASDDSILLAHNSDYFATAKTCGISCNMAMSRPAPQFPLPRSA